MILGRYVPLDRWIAFAAALVLLLGPAAAQEGIFVDSRHRDAKIVVQRYDYATEDLNGAIATLRSLIGEYEPSVGKTSPVIGALLVDIGEAVILRDTVKKGQERHDALRRGLRALEEGDRLLAPLEAQYEAATTARARAHLKIGLAYMELGDDAAAEKALRTGIALHWERFGDAAYQLRFFPPLYAVTPNGDKRVRTAELWLKSAKSFGHPSQDVGAAQNALAAARDLKPAVVEAAERARAEAETLARAGDEDGAYQRLDAAFDAARNDGERRVLIGRTKPSPFLIYYDVHATEQTGWFDAKPGPLSAYDRAAVRYFVDNGLMPAISGGRNNLFTLLNQLTAIYRSGDQEGARAFCRLVPVTYGGYAERLPEACSNPVDWAAWHLSMGNFDDALDLLSMTVDLERGHAATLPPAASAVHAALREIALMQARYGSPDSFLAALEALEQNSPDIATLPPALRFYAGVLRDDPQEVEGALRTAGHFDRVDEDELPGASEESGNPYVGGSLRERMEITGRRVAQALCRTDVEGLPKLVRLTQCRRAGEDSTLAVEDLPAAREIVTEKALLTSASPELIPLLSKLGTQDLSGRMEATMVNPTLPLAAVDERILKQGLDPDGTTGFGTEQYDINKAAVAQAFVKKGKLQLARAWADDAFISYQTSMGGATIVSAWLIESFRETRYREGWVWLAMGYPIIAEAAFDDFVPGERPETSEGQQEAPTQEFDWSRSFGGLQGRMLAREALGDMDGAKSDARALIAFVGTALRRQSFSRFETRELVSRLGQPGLRDALRVLFGASDHLDIDPGSEAFESAFAALQLLKPSTTSTTVTRLAARLSESSPELSTLARRREDLRQLWDTRRLAALRTPSGESTREAHRLADELAEIDARMIREFPTYVELSGSIASNVEDVRIALGGDRVLISTSAVEADVYVAVLSAEAGTIRRLAGGTAPLREHAATLRRSLEPKGGRFLRYRREEGRAIFDAVLRPVWDLIARPEHTTLIQISDGPLESLPFSVLPTRDADQFVIDDIAVARMPSVSSLVLLDRVSAAGSGDKPFLGVGDPLLDGDPTQSRGLEASDLYGVGGAGGIDPQRLRALPRLPETAEEIRRLAKVLGADGASIALGGDATEAAFRTRRLGDYRIIAFATHGLVAGQYPGLSEPGLVLTPSAVGGTSGDADDGFLSASEIGTLDIAADMVLLSACNTAAPSGSDAEGLSGLSKSFFFAGARNLLVSHWTVQSDAAVALTTEMIDARQSGRAVNYSSALRQAIIGLRRSPNTDIARHPGFWGPFDVVGF